MILNSQKTAQRDVDVSVFSEILARIESVSVGFLAAIFFDHEGETIDYHSYLDPFDTRLAGAHHGVIATMAMHQMKWLKKGELQSIEIYTDDMDSATYHLGEGCYLTIIMKSETNTDALRPIVNEVIRQIKEEAGIL